MQPRAGEKETGGGKRLTLDFISARVGQEFFGGGFFLEVGTPTGDAIPRTRVRWVEGLGIYEK